MAVLEASVTSKTRENFKNMPKNDKKQIKKVLVVAQELKLARVLAGNNKTARDRALKSLKKWFQNRSTTIPFTEDDFLRLWKGLFYSMWMSDKPLVQEECAENISNLVHALPLDSAILFYKAGMTILMNEWFGIDQLRLDKFLMFVRRLLRQVFFVLRNQSWTRDSIGKFTECLGVTILEPQKQKPMGLLLHFIEIYLEELAKVAEGELPPQLLTEFLKPFIKQLAYCDDARIINHIRTHVFTYLIRQSNLGLEYDEKYKAWRALGFPGSIDSMKRIEFPEDESEMEKVEEEAEKEKVYDPRAGRVNVDLPQLIFHSKAIVKALSEHKFEKLTNSKSRAVMKELAEQFKKLASGIYPLGIKKVKLHADNYDTNIRKAVNRLVKFDQKIKGKKNRKRKNQEEHEIVLRGGKTIKLDEGLTQQIHQELNNISRKRKSDDVTEVPPPKLKKKEPLLEIESIFKRNSGTWLVTKTVQRPEKKAIKKKPEEIIEESTVSLNGETHKVLFPKTQWDNSNDETAVQVENSLKSKRLSLPMNFLKNPFYNSTPTKKVKINTKLNRSQEVQEHIAQVSTPIQYDGDKKPLKPILKTPTTTSPINPFYRR